VIEFGPNGVIEYGFGSGTGHDQEERFANAYWSQMLGVRRGTCRTCQSTYVSNTQDIAGTCNGCLETGQAMGAEKIHPPSVTPGVPVQNARDSAPEKPPAGIDGLDDWQGTT
jgi:hypothetical protein